MFIVPNTGINGESVEVYEYNEAVENGTTLKLSMCNYAKLGNKTYVNMVNTFDIEATSVRQEECGVFGKDFGFMYVWQACIDGEVFMGREWWEFIELLNTMCRRVDGILVVYIHFLAYEFQFIRNFVKVIEVFAREPRKPIKALCKVDGGLVEFRCSYFLSNMGLDKYLKTGKNITFYKKSGDNFNYGKKRFPDTELSLEELQYCVCDVLGLYQRITEELQSNNDDIATIPMTSTGYVRRDYRNAMAKNPKNRKVMLNCALDTDTYTACNEAARGGLSGSNHINTGYILENVDSWDKKSSYPYQMMCKYFPVTRLVPFNPISQSIEKCLDTMCCLILWECQNLRLNRYTSIPYITKDKCRAIIGGHFGNGKVYVADRIGMLCTEIDLRIIREHYNFTDFKIHRIWVAERGQLSKEFRGHLGEMFQIKTDMEDGDEFLYNKYKNKINGSFGMMLTNVLMDRIEYQAHGEPWETVKLRAEDYVEELNRYYDNKNSFLSYQHGVWVTAHAREDLVEGMDIAGSRLVQVDTDSVKAMGSFSKEFQKINKRIRDKAEEFDVKPYAMKGNEKVYLGIWEHEHVKGDENSKYTYAKFKTWGAKKYAYEDRKGHMHITVAGLNPEKGAKFFEMNGGLEAFEVGKTVPEEWSGRTESKYVDLDFPTTIYVQGHRIVLGSNIAVFNSRYTLGITDEWNEVISGDALGLLEGGELV